MPEVIINNNEGLGISSEGMTLNGNNIYLSSRSTERSAQEPSLTWQRIQQEVYNQAVDQLYNQCNRQNNDRKEIEYIQSYNYLPEKFNFNKAKDEEDLYLGIELEIDNGGKNHQIAKQVCDTLNKNGELVYCKHDGSLKDGFEIVTHPCTYEFHSKVKYKKVFDFLVRKGYRSHDVTTCGMHVHINRNYFGTDKLTQDLCISKLLYLYEKFWDKVEIVARRKSNHYANRFYLNEGESPIDLYAKSKDASKYGAINLKHKDTIEVRIFKGTLKYETFINTLEFVNKMTKLAKDTDIYEIQYVTWDKITELFSEELNQYILDREEQQKKEEKEKVKEALSITRGSWGRFDYEPIPVPTASYDINPEGYHGWYFPNGVSGSMATMNIVEANHHELTEEETILRNIKNIKLKIRRSRNGLEITNLNRELALLENQLRLLRRSNRTT